MNKILFFTGKLLLRFSIYFTISIVVFLVSFKLYPYVFFIKYLFDYVDMSLLPFILMVIAAGSFLIALCVELVCSGYFFPNLKYIWRIIILFSINTTMFAVIALVFKWFPAGNLQAWISLILYVTIINLCWGGSIVIKTKLQDRKDNKLLEKYKKRIE